MNRYTEEEKKTIVNYIETQSNELLYVYYEEIEGSHSYNQEEKNWIMELIKKKMLK